MEKLEKGAQAVTKPVVKTGQEAFKDALQSLTGNYGKPIEEKKQVEQIEQSKNKKLQEIRARLAQINKEIMEARKKREKRQEHQENQENQEKQEKQEKRSVDKRKKESVLQKMIKSRQGSKEAMQRASG